MKKTLKHGLLLSLILPASAIAAENKGEEVQDMSDPLAVYTQAGFGITDKGLNVKIGKTYNTGSETQMGMNLIELKGVGGEQFGWSGSSSRDDSIDSFRFRNFTVDLVNGRGSQLDINYSVEQERADISYSFIQALPKFGPVQFFPLAGVGASVQNNAMNSDGEISDGYTMPGTYALIGTYAKITITEKIWLNYNPMYLTAISGSDFYKDHAFGLDTDAVFAQEFAASYQINPVMNLRYFANWSDKVDFMDGDHRIEFNYQF